MGERTSARRRFVAMAAIGFAGLTAVFGAMHGAPLRFLVLDTSFGLSFVIAGYVAWLRRPETPYGPLLVAASAMWFVGSYAPAGVMPYALIGFSFERYYDLVLALIALTFPGVAVSRPTRIVLLGLTAAYVARSGARLLIGCECMPNEVAIIDDRALFDDVQVLTSAVIASLALVVAILAVARLMAAASSSRRLLAPVAGAGAVAAVIACWDAIDLITFIETGEGTIRLPDPWAEIATWSILAAVASVPIAYLVAVLRMRASSGPLAPLAIMLSRRPGPAELQRAVRDALRDRSAALWRWDAGVRVWRDVDGALVDQGMESSAATTVVQGADGPIAMIVHDIALREDIALLDAVSALVGLALDNERLADEVRDRLNEVTASRSRIVAAGEAERRRIERNLHDGAQHRLISVALALQAARADAADGLPTRSLLARLDDTADELACAIDELRELARGIHPTLLVEEGLAVAVKGLARRASVPVRIQIDLAERPDPAVEAAAYFVISEGLANIARHARATSVTVTINHDDCGIMVVVVGDDGGGGADERRGSGLRGLGDRLDAIGGTLTVDNPADGGTRLTARIPCG